MPTPETSTAVQVFEGQLVSAKAVGMIVEKTIQPIVITEVTFLKFSKSEIFIKKVVNKIYYLLF